MAFICQVPESDREEPKACGEVLRKKMDWGAIMALMAKVRESKDTELWPLIS